MNIILASSSPRRTEILNLANIKHLVVPSTIEEVVDQKQSPAQIVKSLANQKAHFIAQKYPYDIIIGADTIVVVGNVILGKPKNQEDAIRMLKLLSGKTHKVITGVSIISPNKEKSFAVTTTVDVAKLNQSQILQYLEEKNVYDKAGAYAIQGAFCKYILKIKGDYYNVMGLPIAKVYEELKEYTNEIQ